MKHLPFLFFFLPLFSIAQKTLNDPAKINFDTTYAIGEISTLPDTIIIFTNENQIGPRQNYTKLKKTKTNIYQLWYWVMERGGIVDPASYKYDLRINVKKNNEVKLTFHSRKKVYFIRTIQSTIGLKYELIKK